EHRQIHWVLSSDSPVREAIVEQFKQEMTRNLAKYSKMKMEGTAQENPPRVKTVRGTAVTHVATIYHLSDIHFGAAGERGRIDRLRTLNALIEHIKADTGKNGACWVLVSGDLAFGGQKEEYEEAYTFVNRVVAAAGTTTARARVVPGNHDVDRKLTEGWRTF